MIPAVLGAYSGLQRCRVLLYEQRLYKSLIFTSDVLIWEVIQFLESALHNVQNKRRLPGLLGRNFYRQTGSYALYITSVKKALELEKNQRLAEGPDISNIANENRVEETKPWRKLLSYNLKDKAIPLTF